MLTLLRKLRGRSADELRVRARQAVAAARERARGPERVGADGSPLLARALDPARADARDAAAALAAFRAGTLPPFFAAFDDPAATVAAVRTGWPDAEAALRVRADRAILGRMDVLGFDALDYGAPIDWHRDPLSGRRAPLVHWSRVPYLDPAVVGDHKIVWEVNRHQHLVTFGQAYWLTGDARYADAFAEQIASWMDANPPKLGINWASSLEVGFRAMSWLWALHYFRAAPQLTPALFGRTLAYLHLAARHLEQYLSTYFSPNTHLTGEALALLHVGTLLPVFRDAARWRDTGWRVLCDQLAVQVRPDGVYFEQASYYHRYTADFYLHAVLLRERAGDPVPPAAHAGLARLLDHLAAVTRPDGRISLVGDDDGGRLVMLTGRHPADARATLAVGAARYGRADWATAAAGGSEELAWIAGPAGVAACAAAARTPVPARSRAFPDGGYFVMRDGEGADGSYVLIDCGPHGALSCGHAHADALAIELAVGGRPVLVDAGTFTYPGPERDAFRNAAAHNTTTLDGESSSVPGTAFGWRTVAAAAGRRWAADARFAYFEGAHDGYRRLAAPATVSREVLQVAGWGWVVADRVESAAPHTLRVHHHVAPGLAARAVPGGAAITHGGAGDARAVLWIAPPRRVDGSPGARVILSESWVSPLYGARTPATRVDLEVATAPGVHEAVTALLPRAGDGLRADEGRAVRGRIFAFTDGGVRPAVVMRGGALGAAAGAVETDAEWVWLSPSLEAPDEFVMIGGSRLLVAGDEVVRLHEPDTWVVGDRHGGEWRLRYGRIDRFA